MTKGKHLDVVQAQRAVALKQANSGKNSAPFSILFTHGSLVVEVYEPINARMTATNVTLSLTEKENLKWAMKLLILRLGIFCSCQRACHIVSLILAKKYPLG